MQTISLQAVPNQAFTIVLDNNEWSIRLKTAKNITCVSLTRNGIALLENTRALANKLIIPYRYLESGNFLFITKNFQLPNYLEFGVTQSLVYVTAAELAEARLPPTLPITADFFNPIAPLPLRFSPQGYTQEGFMLLEGGTGLILLEGGASPIFPE